MLALEPFPTRAATAAGLMGAIRSGVSCLVSVSSGAINEHTPRPLCMVMSAFAVAKLLTHMLLRPSTARRQALLRDGTAADSSNQQVVEELKRAHEGAAQDAINGRIAATLPVRQLAAGVSLTSTDEGSKEGTSKACTVGAVV